MLEDQVANLLQRYLGNYVEGLSKEALKISVWRGDVELKNMQLKPEALNALKLPVKVKAGFLGSVKLKVPWSRLGQDPVLVYLDRIFLLAEPATQVEGCSEDAVQEAKKNLVREIEMKLLERTQQLKSEVNKSWLGSLINTIIGNLKLSVSNIHIRYEDFESNPGHPFAAGVTLEKLSAVTVDDNGKETFITSGALDCIQKCVELERLAIYLDSDIIPWQVDKSWEDLQPLGWDQVFRNGTKGGKPSDDVVETHTYILQPVTGNAKYTKLRSNESSNSQQPLQKAVVNLDDVTLSLSKDGYKDILKLADNFAAFNQRLKYAHYRPLVSVKSDPRSWWKYAYRAVSDQIKKASGRLSWEHVLRYAGLRKKYISLYASLLKSDLSQAVVDDNKDIKELDRELDIDLILQWRMLAHKFVEQSVESDMQLKKQKEKKSWWSFGWSSQSDRDDNEPLHFSEEDWERLNNIIGYKEGDDGQPLISRDNGDVLHTLLEVHMKHNASKLIAVAQECLAELSCESLNCSIRLYSEAKVFDVKLGSYRLSSPNGLIAESATAHDSLVGVFSYKPFDVNLDWSMVAKASPCYVIYLKDSIDQIVNFFESNTAVSQTIALETAAAVQVTFDEVKRTAQQQMNRALKDHARFMLDLDIAAPKITIPTDFRPDNTHSTKLMLDLGNFLIRTQDDHGLDSPEDMDIYLQFDLVLSDVSAFLVDGDYHWGQIPLNKCAGSDHLVGVSYLPVIDKCGVILKLQQIRIENPSYPSTRLALRLPSLSFHFSPARYHRLMQVAKIFQEEDDRKSDFHRPWNQADFEGWLSLLVWKGVGNREAVWQRRYFCLVGPFLYILEKPGSKSYKQCISLRGKQVYQVPSEFVGGMEHVLAVCDATRSNSKVVEDVNALILRCDSDDSRRIWHSRLQGCVYRASGSAPITSLSETSSDHDDSETELVDNNDVVESSMVEKVFITGVLDELKICFSYKQMYERSFVKVLLAEESCLFEFRAIGGQVQLSIRSNDMFIGTVLKSLEIEDLICHKGVSEPSYLARSFIGNVDAASSYEDAGSQSWGINDLSQSDGDEKFYEAADNMVDIVDYPMQSPGRLQQSLTSEKLSLKPPSFSRIAHLLPDDARTGREVIEPTDNLDSFVKAQIVIYDHNSLAYDNIDKKVIVTLATLSFFCRRPTIVAIMEFVNAINAEDESCETFSDNSSPPMIQNDTSREDVVDDQHLTMVEEPVAKGLLGKGKSRIIFYLTLNMARAQILLMKENETKLMTLSQDNLRTDIKVYPSSFGIKAALGNLRISDDSLHSSHIYFWVCDMRNPGGSSFVELVFNSFSADEEDYEGYDYSLTGQLSEVRFVYLNRFIQEVVCYVTGIVPNNSKDVVKIKDQVTNSEKWFTSSEIEGSPAVKLDLSLKKPIILMPQRTDSLDYLKLDVVHITIQNTFRWICGGKSEMNAVHMEILTVLVEDINLNVGIGTELGESIIQDVKGVSVTVRRSLRDLLHQIPGVEAAIKIEELKAALSNKEYQIITECALSNISETPNLVPSLDHDAVASSSDLVEPLVSQAPGAAESETQNGEVWVALKVSVVIDLIELCLHSGVARDASLATVQVSGAWLLYKSNTQGEGYLSATLKCFSVIDDREGTEHEFRLAIGKSESIGYSPLYSVTDGENQPIVDAIVTRDNGAKPVPTMVILDAKFSQSSTSVSLCIQRPQLLVALDFLLAVLEFFVPTVGNMLSNEEDENSLSIVDAIILDQSTYTQPSSEFSLSPQKPLVADDERFDHFIYDGRGGTLHLQDRQGFDLFGPSLEPIIYVGNGKKLQFKNVFIKSGQFLDSCILLGTNCRYSASEHDQVFLEGGDEAPYMDTSRESINRAPLQSSAVDRSTELIIELQAIGPELTFYNTSKDVAQSPILSNKLLHAQLDAFCRLVLKGDTTEMSANALGLTMESNGIRILEPLDTSVKFSSASGKTNIHLDVSDVFVNFSFSILKLFLAVEEDLLAFLRMTSKKMTVVCSEFDKVGTIEDPGCDQIYAFWRPRAPPGFAVLGDYLTPLDKPPTKGVLAVNTGFIRVKRPVSFKLIWPPLNSEDISDFQADNYYSQITNNALGRGDGNCSIWFPEAPKGYVALGCVVTPRGTQPSVSSAFCILASLVSPCALRDCITVTSSNVYHSSLAFWRVDNSIGTFLPADPTTLSLRGKAYELRHIFFQLPAVSPKPSKSSELLPTSGQAPNVQSERSSAANSGRRFEAIASFKLIWWNRGSGSRKKLSIWRPVVPQGMVYFGDIAAQGYEPPNSCLVLHDSGDDELFKSPLDYQLVGQIKKYRGVESISFWLPQAPPGFVSLGCITCKSTPKKHDFSSLRCMRNDMVSGDQFLEESLWDSSDSKVTTEPFSIWAVANDLGTFLARTGFKKPPKRLAFKLADANMPAGSDDTVIDAEIRTFSAALFDDYGGMMVPLFNISLSSIGFSLHGRSDYLNSTVSFSLAARSYSDKYDAWEPLVEPVDGFLRYQYDLSAPGAASQVRLTSMRDLNLNVSISNANMIFQAYASWNNLSHVHESYKKQEAVPPSFGGRSIIGAHHKRDYFIIPKNKLGQDIFIRVTEVGGLSSIIRMPPGNVKPVKVPVLKNMLDSHLNGKLCRKLRILVTIIIADAEFPSLEGPSSHQYTVAVRLTPDQCFPSSSVPNQCFTPDQCFSNGSLPNQQSARTCGSSSDYSLSTGLELVNWNEMFFFKVDYPDHYMVDFIVTDIGRGDPIGYFSAPLLQMARNIHDILYSYDYLNELSWIDLLTTESMKIIEGDQSKKLCGKIRCAIILSPSSELENSKQSFIGDRKSGFIHISPTREGPWTTVRLNYAAPAACWRFGNDVVASEVSIEDGNRCMNIRSLVSVCNKTNFMLDLSLKPKAPSENVKPISDVGKLEGSQSNNDFFQMDEFFETEKYSPTMGWLGCLDQTNQDFLEGRSLHEVISGVELPSGWQWTGDWTLDRRSVNTADGWVYAPDIDSLKWPESYNPLKFVNYARQRRWVRTRKRSLDDVTQQIPIGQLNPGETIPLPLSGLTQSGLFILQLRPSNLDNEYSWSSMVDTLRHSEDSHEPDYYPEICVSTLTESDRLLHCTRISGTSSDHSRGLWFGLSIQATEIAKDIHSNPVQDWNLLVKPPLSVTNFLPMAAEISVLEMQAGGNSAACSRAVLFPGKTLKVHDADIRNPMFLSLLPQGGWLPIPEAVLISHPKRVPSKTISLRSSISGRIVQIMLEQNYDKEQPLLAKIIRAYAPCWFSIARCPSLTYRLLDMTSRKNTHIPFLSKKNNELILEEVTEEEIYHGYTISSALNFKLMGLSVSINQSGKGQFGPVKDLSPLGDMDGSLDLNAYDADGNCMRLFISSKPSPYQSVPTKVISVRPFMTFTNRLGKDLFIKLSSEDEPKVLRAYDSRVSFVYRETAGPDKLQVRLEDTGWSFPIHILKEDTVCLVLRKHDGSQTFLRTEIRGYEEGSHFIVVFRVGSTNCPIRIENRTFSKMIQIRQSGFGDDAWIQLEPLSTTNFSWEDPYGQKLIDTVVNTGSSIAVWQFDLEKAGVHSAEDGVLRIKFHVADMGDIKVARFTEDGTLGQDSHESIWFLTPAGKWEISHMQGNMQSNTLPVEIIIDLAIVGVSVIDHRPRELCYLYLERVFISYSTGYDSGTTDRFKLILGFVQLDNQLPLTAMPVLLVPEQTTDIHHPVLKTTMTMRNMNTDGVQVLPYVYIRVTEKLWRLSIHEPIIWALVDFYANLQLDRLPKGSTVTQVDPVIRINLIDVSEVRLKVSLETEPAQRPHGVLGVWSPILSAVGNAFKIQLHLRKVVRRDRFMRKSSVIRVIGNRIWRDLIHNPLHLIFSLDVLGMTSSTLASLSKGFADLSTDGQFLQLRSKQVRSRRITGVADGIIHGTEAFAQGVAFGVSGVVTKPVESARLNGLIGLAHGLGRAFLGFIVQPVSGALDFVSLTVDGLGASCSRCLEVFNNKMTFQRIRNPRAIHVDGTLREYCEREAVGQMILYLAEASRNFGCTEIFKEPSKFASSDHYEDHFIVPHQRIVLVTSKRVMLLQCPDLDKMDKKPCKIMWDVPWEELMALELAKVGCPRPSHLILHLKTFRRSEVFVRVIKCSAEEESGGQELQAVRICSSVHKMWKAYQSDMKCVILKVPSSQGRVYFAWGENDRRDLLTQSKSIIRSRELSLPASSASEEKKFVKHGINFLKVWNSERQSKIRYALCRKQVSEDDGMCSIWRPVCPEGYVSIGDIARVGCHPPNVAAVYRNIDQQFTLPVGYDLVWRNCLDDYKTPVSIWLPRPPEGFVSLGCVAVPSFAEPEPDLAYCVAESLTIGTMFEEQKVWSAPDSYPWACHIYQVQSDALQFVALRQPKEDSDWKPLRVREDSQPPQQIS
ncbi:uncharacterized protein LOC131164992 isoform X2 [Malania oleifera]|uniref:uncharacterized protein LOC131164992 isoform X2 n=1 Tax=Malania oleifera TaxID=397392 RepID=UPI0025AE7650|nr:uncharacterized protein LOC131164992 isoform X2 [Malania oleifera]